MILVGYVLINSDINVLGLSDDANGVFDIQRTVHPNTRVGTLIVATIYLQLIQNRYMFRSFTVLQCSHQHCLQTRCQRCGSRRIPLAAPVVLIVRMERSTA